MTKPLSDWENKHNRRVDSYAAQVERLYAVAVREMTRLAESVSFNPSRPFRFSDYPETLAQSQRILTELARSVEVLIESGTAGAWQMSNEKNNALVDSVFSSTQIDPARLAVFRQPNELARIAFQNRVTSGMNLSNRVWKYAGQLRSELEMALDVGLSDGQSAARLARSVKQYLNEPDKLFRRVRNSRGALVLSQNAQTYKPGRGVYRSSVKNAQRLARTEINMAYRTADYERYSQLPFVVGIEVRRSNNPFPCVVCDAAKGRYPKAYKFVGNHANCRCYTVPILATGKELDEINRRILVDESLDGFRSENEVTAIPSGFSDYVSQNRGRWESPGRSTPMFAGSENLRFFPVANLRR